VIIGGKSGKENYFKPRQRQSPIALLSHNLNLIKKFSWWLVAKEQQNNDRKQHEPAHKQTSIKVQKRQKITITKQKKNQLIKYN
jgi:hypothetical protein